MSDVKALYPDYPKLYARWTVVIGGGKSPTKWAKKPPTIHKSTAELSHIGEGPRLARTSALARGVDKANANANFVAYSPIVQRPYVLGVAKTLLRGWRHRLVCVLHLGL